MKLGVVVLAALSVAACELNLPMGTPELDAAGKAFSPPRADRAALYVYQASNSGAVLNMTLDQRTLGALGPGNYLRVDVAPGTYSLRCVPTVLPDMSAMNVELRPGTTTYINGRMVPLSSKPCRIELVDPSAAQATIRRGARVQEVGGASDP